MTIDESAKEQYPGITYDCALPQPWVDKMAEAGIDVRGRVVWGYPDRCLFGEPLPLDEGMRKTLIDLGEIE